MIIYCLEQISIPHSSDSPGGNYQLFITLLPCEIFMRLVYLTKKILLLFDHLMNIPVKRLLLLYHLVYLPKKILLFSHYIIMQILNLIMYIDRLFYAKPILGCQAENQLLYRPTWQKEIQKNPFINIGIISIHKKTFTAIETVLSLIVFWCIIQPTHADKARIKDRILHSCRWPSPN